MTVHRNWTYSLSVPSGQGEVCLWDPIPLSNGISSIEVSHTPTSNDLSIQSQDSTRLIADVSQLLNTTREILDLNWLVQTLMATGHISLTSIHLLCLGNGSLPSDTTFHVQHAIARKLPYANRVQVAVPFLGIVIVANIAKLAGIYLTTRMCSTGHTITSDDAITSFLQAPEALTQGKCTSTKSSICRFTEELEPKLWRVVKKPRMLVLGSARIWSFTIMYVVCPESRFLSPILAEQP
jgi:hypothetical protein